MKGVTIILIKGYNGKSRLALDQNIRMRLIDALSSDLYKTVSETSSRSKSWDCFIASPDRLFLERCKKKKLPILALNPGKLNSILRQIQKWAVKEGYKALILCAGDIPLLSRDLIDRIKRRLLIGVWEEGKSMIVCPSKANGVSIIAMSPANLWMITSRDGIDNLNVIKGLDRDIYPYYILDDIGSYFDLDHQEDLVSAWMFMDKNPSYRNRLVTRILYEFIEAKSSDMDN